MVHDGVDDRGGEFVVREDRAPCAGLDVRGGDDAPSFVAACDDPVFCQVEVVRLSVLFWSK